MMDEALARHTAVLLMRREFSLSDEMQIFAGKIQNREELPGISDKLFQDLLSCQTFAFFESNAHSRQNLLKQGLHGGSVDRELGKHLENEQLLHTALLWLLDFSLRLSDAQKQQLIPFLSEQFTIAAKMREAHKEGGHEIHERGSAAAHLAKSAAILLLNAAAHQLDAGQLEQAFPFLDAHEKLSLMKKCVDKCGILDEKTRRLFNSTVTSILQDRTLTSDGRVKAFNFRKALESAKPQSASGAFSAHAPALPAKAAPNKAAVK